MPANVAPARTFEFWLGRAGSGKTHACLDAIARRVIRQPRGEPLLFLVPEQASASMEQALAHRIDTIQADSKDPDYSEIPVRGYTRARVLSFRLLKEEVFTRTGGRPTNIVDEQSRILLLRRAIRRRRNDLKIFGASAELPGLAVSVNRSLEEFQRFGWERKDLMGRVEALSAEGRDHEVLRLKLQDLALIWQGYNDLLEELGYADLPELNAAAASRIEQWDALQGAQVWIDGFASFNEEELHLLDALLSQASRATLALCLDPLDFHFQKLSDPKAAIPDSPPRVGSQRTFEVLEQTFLQVRARLQNAGWHTTYRDLPVPDQRTRFDRCVALDVLEAEVLTELSPPEDRNAGWPEALPGGSWPSGPIELLEAVGRRGEVEAIARRIASLIAENTESETTDTVPMKPSEIAVLVRNLETYAPLVRELFPRYGIPHFIDTPRSLHRHPLSRLLLTVLRYARTGNWTTELALDYLKTGLAPLSDLDEIARLERLASRRRLKGHDWKDVKHWVSRADAEKEGIPEDAQTLFDAWRSAAAPAERLRDMLTEPSSGSATALSTLLTDLDAGPRLAEWESAARAQGDEEAASIHERAVKAVEDLLLRLHEIDSHAPLPKIEEDSLEDKHSLFESIDELEEMLDAALHAVRGRLIPPSREQVIVGQIDRSRTPMQIRAAFVMGMADGEFPRAYEEDPILGDQERKAITAESSRLGPDSSQRYALERFFSYIALTRSSERLVVTRPLQGDRGQPLQPSSPFHAIHEAFPAAGPHTAREDETHHPGSLPERPESWASRLTGDFHRASAGDATALSRLLRSPHPLTVQARLDESARLRMAHVLHALEWPRPAALSPEISRVYWSENPALSPTGLEEYGACPFRFFASRMLRLERPLDLTPGPLELGELRHALLEKLFIILSDGKPLRWGDVDIGEAEQVLETIAPEIARDLLEDRFGRDALTEILLNDAVEDLKVFVRVLKKMGKRYGFAQVDAEYRFGPHRHRPLEIPASGELVFTLRGSVDRVDADPDSLGTSSPNLVIYDFKSAAQTSQHSAARYYQGLSLQMAVYTMALRRNFASRQATASPSGQPSNEGVPAHVAGFFYWPLSLGVARESADDSAEPASDAWFAKHRAKGLFDAEIATSLDTTLEPGDKALAFGFSLTKNGELSKASFGPLRSGGFDRYLNHVERLIKQRAENIANGEIRVEPLATPLKACDLCDFSSVCRVATCGAAAFQYPPGCTPRQFRELFEIPPEDDA